MSIASDRQPVITPAMIDAERKAGMSEEMIQQEFYCSFEAPLIGSYYGRLMMEAEKEKRIGNVPHEPGAPVETMWDLGFTDSMAIWFRQRVGKEIRLIDYYENSGEPLSHYAAMLQRKQAERGFVYGSHYLPHDGRNKSLQTGMTPQEVLAKLGIRCEIVPQHDVLDGIEACRQMLPKCWFDMTRCERGILALRSYRKEPQPEGKWANQAEPEYKDHPVHDWASHGADAFRTGAMAQPQAVYAPIEYPKNHVSRGVL